MEMFGEFGGGLPVLGSRLPPQSCLEKEGQRGEGGYVWGFRRWHTSSQNHPTKVHFRHEKMEMGVGWGFWIVRVKEP